MTEIPELRWSFHLFFFSTKECLSNLLEKGACVPACVGARAHVCVCDMFLSVENIKSDSVTVPCSLGDPSSTTLFQAPLLCQFN